MLDYTQFQQVFPANLRSPYDRKLQQDIDGHRKTLSGVLFIDRVLRALGIAKGVPHVKCPEKAPRRLTRPDSAKVYPPKTDNALKQLHQSVCDAGVSTHHKLSLFYYVLLDFDGANGAPYISQEFIAASSLPANYQLFMQGLWHMDHLEFSVRHPSCSTLRHFTNLLFVSRARSNTFRIRPSVQISPTTSSSRLSSTPPTTTTPSRSPTLHQYDPSSNRQSPWSSSLTPCRERMSPRRFCIRAHSLTMRASSSSRG